MMNYPISLEFEYPERFPRLTTFFRYLMIMPQWVAIMFVSIAAYVVMFLSWWTFIFAASYPRVFSILSLGGFAGV